MGVHFTSIAEHLHQLGKVHKLAQSVPHVLADFHCQQCVEAATALFLYRQTDN